MNIKLTGESSDLACNPTRSNMVVKTSFGGFKLAEEASWDNWKMGIVFPNEEKAQYFLKTFNSKMLDYRDGMLKEDYVVHVIHFKYPKPESLYADQIKMTADYVTEEY